MNTARFATSQLMSCIFTFFAGSVKLALFAEVLLFFVGRRTATWCVLLFRVVLLVSTLDFWTLTEVLVAVFWTVLLVSTLDFWPLTEVLVAVFWTWVWVPLLALLCDLVG